MEDTNSEGVLMNIPTPIITDILARLPPKAVIRSSCVCKAWLKLISEPEFVNLHKSKSPACLIVHKVSHSSPRSPRSPDSACVNLVEIEDETDHHGVRPIAGTNRKIPTSRNSIGMTMIGSIDGLVCINEYASQYALIHVWNPIMGEFITVQTPGKGGNYPNVTTYGFGISSGKYLVVKIFQEIENNYDDSATNSQWIRDSTCYVYTIGDGVWKSIGHAPYLYSCQHCGLFFNGNIYWIIKDKDNSEQICCLDLKKELFQPFPPPPELCLQPCATLNLYKGCLSVCNYKSDFNTVIWVMKEYGVPNSWSKEVVISKHLTDPKFVNGYVQIIKVFEDGKILLLWLHHGLFTYHPKWNTVQNIDVKESLTGPNNNPDAIEITDYISSIVSLKSLGEVDINRSLNS